MNTLQRTLRIIGGVALMIAGLSGAAGASDEMSVREANRAWILEHNPDYDPDAIVELYHGGTVEHVTAAQAMERTLDRTGETLLGDAPAPASHGSQAPVYVGNIWIIGTGQVDCGDVTRLAEVPFAPVFVSDELGGIWQYAGYATDASATDYRIISWTMVETYHGSGSVHYGGNSDFYCIDGPGMELLFPYISGYAIGNEGPLPYLPSPGLPNDAL